MKEHLIEMVQYLFPERWNTVLDCTYKITAEIRYIIAGIIILHSQNIYFGVNFYQNSCLRSVYLHNWLFLKKLNGCTGNGTLITLPSYIIKHAAAPWSCFCPHSLARIFAIHLNLSLSNYLKPLKGISYTFFKFM